jgi:hypothetical protein
MASNILPRVRPSWEGNLLQHPGTDTTPHSKMTDRRWPDHAPAHLGPEAEQMHLALFYGSAEEYRQGVLNFAEPAIAAGQPVAVAVPADKAALLEQDLRMAGAEPEIFDMVELGRNPARIIPAVESMLAHHPGRVLHYVGEPLWAGRSPEEISTWRGRGPGSGSSVPTTPPRCPPRSSRTPSGLTRRSSWAARSARAPCTTERRERRCP